MKNRIVFYLPKDALFEATIYYCNLIKRAILILPKSFEVVYVDQLSDISQDDIVITIRIDDPFKLFGKCKKIIHWFQGIAPEERLLANENSFYSRLASFKYMIMEYILIRKVDLPFFVSEAMRTHYERKYKFKLSERFVLMPCYNIALDENSFFVNQKYEQPNFVYAGGILKWQCIEETLSVFKAFKDRVPQATLTILTKDKEKALSLVKIIDCEDVDVKFIPLELLQSELSRYKYGFLLRKDHVVNKVSTPTKMNSYLSAGIIPIYTSAVQAFEQNIDLGDFELKFDTLDIEEIVSNLILMENKTIDASTVLMKYKKVFENFYNDEFYINKIGDQFQKYIQ